MCLLSALHAICLCCKYLILLMLLLNVAVVVVVEASGCICYYISLAVVIFNVMLVSDSVVVDNGNVNWFW